jgi:hypothetical protein
MRAKMELFFESWVLFVSELVERGRRKIQTEKKRIKSNLLRLILHFKVIEK